MKVHFSQGDQLKDLETTKEIENKLALLVTTFQSLATKLFLKWNTCKVKNVADDLENCLLLHIYAVCKAFTMVVSPQHNFMARLTDPRIQVATTPDPREPETAQRDLIAAYALLLTLRSEEAFALAWWSFSDSREHLFRTATSTLPVLKKLLLQQPAPH